jgi:radical SAM-linked protein
VRLTLSKTGPAVFLGHLEFKEALIRSLRRAGWPVAYSRGFHPQLKASFGPACPVGVESHAELVDVSVVGPVKLGELLGALAEHLPRGVAVTDGKLPGAESSSIMKEAISVCYRIRPASGTKTGDTQQAVEALLAQDAWNVTRERKGRKKVVNVRPSLLSCRIERSAQYLELVCELALTPGPCARPQELAQAIFGGEPGRVVREAIRFPEPSPPEED